MSRELTVERRTIAGSNSLADLAARIRAEHEAMLDTFRRGIDRAIACGELLNEAKRRLSHGRWLPWLRDHVELSPRMAQNYMRLADHKDTIARANAKSPSHFGPLSIEAGLEFLRARYRLPTKEAFQTLRQEITADREQRWQAIEATAPEVLDPNILRLCTGVYLQQVDDERIRDFHDDPSVMRSLQLTPSDVATVSALARTRAELIERAEAIEAEAARVREEIAAIERQIRRAVRKAFLPVTSTHSPARRSKAKK